MKVVTSPLRKVHSLIRTHKRHSFVHCDTITTVVDNAKAKLNEKIELDASWCVMSNDEIVKVSKLKETDLNLFFKLADISNDSGSRVLHRIF